MTDVKYQRYIEGKYILCKTQIQNLGPCTWFKNKYSHFARAKKEPASAILKPSRSLGRCYRSARALPGRTEHAPNTVICSRASFGRARAYCHAPSNKIFLPDSRAGLACDFLMLVGSAYRREAYQACCINANSS